MNIKRAIKLRAAADAPKPCLANVARDQAAPAQGSIAALRVQMESAHVLITCMKLEKQLKGPLHLPEASIHILRLMVNAIM